MKNNSIKKMIIIGLSITLVLGVCIAIGFAIASKNKHNNSNDKASVEETTLEEKTTESKLAIITPVESSKEVEAVVKEGETEPVTEAVTEPETEKITEVQKSEKNEKPTNESSTTAKVYLGDVNDKTAPKILALNSYITLKVGSEFRPGKYIGYGDDIDSKPTLEVIGNVDTNKIGKYNLTYKVTDASGNSTSANVIVDIVQNIESGSSTGESATYRFDDFIKNYKTDKTSLGIDVSRWQGDIDFEKVAKAGCEFVIIRLGYFSEGVTELDSCFKKNIERAKAAGLKIGIYYYSEDYDKDALKEHVAWIFKELGDYKLDFPVAFDWEDFFAFEDYGISLNELNELYKVFDDEVKKYGYESMLYSSKNYLQNVWTNTDKYNVWLAHYTDVTSYTGNYIMWQKDCIGRIDGIDAYVDLNILYN